MLKSLRGATLTRALASGEIPGEAEGLMARDMHAITGVACLHSAIPGDLVLCGMRHKAEAKASAGSNIGRC